MKEKLLRYVTMLNGQQGVSAIMVGIMLTMLIGFAALAVDMGHLYVVRNELQNAADAGALAGARFLYLEDGTAVNTGANQIAYNTAISNTSEKDEAGNRVPVDVHWAGGNGGDVQRGHWSFATRTFTPNDSVVPVDLWNVSDEDLDANPNFINAVRVVSRREDTPAASFFARIFGHENFAARPAEAAAYIGFAGTLEPKDGDQPIAICKESLLIDGKYTCNIGRMINSGQQIESNETGGWTDFNQDNPCAGGTNAKTIRSLVCGSGNPEPITLGKPIATNGGEIQSAFNDLIKCWESKTLKKTPWNLTLPVVTCPGNNVGTCEVVVGAVNINIVWITGAGDDPGYKDAPTQMGDWFFPADPGNTNGQERWNSFVDKFELQNVDGTPAPYAKKSIYFQPDCTVHIPAGSSGGENFGILAKIPVLVN